jgi:hypothetical protein
VGTNHADVLAMVAAGDQVALGGQTGGPLLYALLTLGRLVYE